MGIMMGCSHFVHGVVLKGSRSPGMKTLEPQPPQVTILSGFFALSVSSDTIREIQRLIPSTDRANGAFPGGGRLKPRKRPAVNPPLCSSHPEANRLALADQWSLWPRAASVPPRNGIPM